MVAFAQCKQNCCSQTGKSGQYYKKVNKKDWRMRKITKYRCILVNNSFKFFNYNVIQNTKHNNYFAPYIFLKTKLLLII